MGAATNIFLFYHIKINPSFAMKIAFTPINKFRHILYTSWFYDCERREIHKQRQWRLYNDGVEFQPSTWSKVQDGTCTKGVSWCGTWTIWGIPQSVMVGGRKVVMVFASTDIIREGFSDDHSSSQHSLDWPPVFVADGDWCMWCTCWWLLILCPRFGNYRVNKGWVPLYCLISNTL